jgi:2-oxoglutarate ferredoxin oxidoreductase subunit delta
MEACTGCASCAKLCPDVAIRVWRTIKSNAKEND